MKTRPACLFLLSIFLSTPALPRTHPQSTKQETPTDAGCDGLRHSQNADQMEDFFSNAKTKIRSFEITIGHGIPATTPSPSFW